MVKTLKLTRNREEENVLGRSGLSWYRVKDNQMESAYNTRVVPRIYNYAEISIAASR